MTRKWSAILATTAAFACGAFVGAATADTPTQAGCQAYGAFISETAQNLNSTTPGGGGAFVSGIAHTSPGAVAETGIILKHLSGC